MASPDSRTAGVGRKRPIPQPACEVISLDSSDEESHPAKRLRRSPPHVNSKAEIDSTSAPLAAPVLEAQHNDDMPRGVNPRPVKYSPAVALPTWNQGVQSGMRTTFGKTPSISAAPLAPGLQNGPTIEVGQPNPFFPEPEAEESRNTVQSRSVGQSETASSKSPVQTGSKKLVTGAKTKVGRMFQCAGTSKTLNLTKKGRKMDRASHMAAEAIDQYGWPLPDGHAGLKAISNSDTFYPCKPLLMKREKETQKHAYFFGEIGYVLEEVLDQGKPVKIQDLTFNMFAMSFVGQNRHLFEPSLTEEKSQRPLPNDAWLGEAFESYLSRFYPHCLPQNLVAEFPKPDLARERRTLLDSIKVLVDGDVTGRAGVPLLKPHDADRGPNLGPALVSSHDYYNGVQDPSVATNDSMSAEDAISSRRKEVHPVDDEDLEALRIYFPKVAGKGPSCLCCGSDQHPSSRCPEMICIVCRSRGDHVSSACLQVVRCGKCRAKGHRGRDCPSKLRAVEGEESPCDLCGSRLHIEDDCENVWRTFIPPADVVSINVIRVVDCYTCGQSGHYGPECGLYQIRRKGSPRTFSQANLARYSGQQSKTRGMTEGKDYSTLNRSTNKGFSIKGKANDPISLESDEEEGAFLHPKVQAPVRPGTIKFGQNQLPNNSYQYNLPIAGAGTQANPIHGFDAGYSPSPRYDLNALDASRDLNRGPPPNAGRKPRSRRAGDKGGRGVSNASRTGGQSGPGVNGGKKRKPKKGNATGRRGGWN